MGLAIHLPVASARPPCWRRPPPLLAVVSNPLPGLRAQDLLGLLIGVAAVAGEAAADRQLAAFRRRPGTAGIAGRRRERHHGVGGGQPPRDRQQRAGVRSTPPPPGCALPCLLAPFPNCAGCFPCLFTPHTASPDRGFPLASIFWPRGFLRALRPCHPVNSTTSSTVL